ncbi:hypothetical protein QFC21_003659 [Naganishia friedmannii]|uniref:Uncharacterized protein n=1 Tax=Naganishia friedmannii TaxID=89922 RepID=A0ACC2VMG9_9TREE|nr:hypothetical protein QFC21_003659 [Naganishia friedmannii]
MSTGPMRVYAVYAVSSVAVVEAGVAFRRYVYDPIKPLLQNMMTTVREHSPCLNDPMDDTDESDEEERLQPFSGRQPLTQQPTWICVNPTISLASRLQSDAKQEERLEREMSLMHISDDQLDQLIFDAAVIDHSNGIHPEEEMQENEARRDLGSTLGNDSIANVDTVMYQDSAITTSVDLSFLNEGSSGTFHQTRLPEDTFLRRRRPEHYVTNNVETSSLLSNDSQCTIVYVPSAIRELTPARNYAGSDQGLYPINAQGPQASDEDAWQSSTSSPELTDSSLVDVSSYDVSSFSESPVPGQERHIALPEALRQRFVHSSIGLDSARGSSPAFSASSWDVLSPPEDIVSMSTSPHSMDTSIVLEPYPPFDEYNRYTIRYMNMDNDQRPLSQMSNPAPSHSSDSSWTDGDTTSEDAYVEI